MDWSYFNKIKCINLIERQDRYENAQTFFAKYDIPAKFHRVQRHPKGGVHGCFESHIQIITEAYEEGCQNVLIFEDDVASGQGLKPEQIQKAVKFMTSNENKDWNIFFFGWHPKIMSKQTKSIGNSIYKVSAYGGHAYVLSRNMIKRLAYAEYSGIPIDVIYAEEEEAYALYPSAFVQDGLESDLVTDFSGSKWMKPVRALAENWSINVNCPVKSLLKAIIISLVVGFILWKIFPKHKEKVIAFVLVLFIILLLWKA